MNTFLWIAASILAVALLATGSMKLVKSRAALATSGLAWVEDFSDGGVKGIGSLEVIAAVGLILPALLHISPLLVPLAATGVVLLMAGATATHVRRKEYSAIAVTVVLGGLALAIAILRFGSERF